MSISSKCSFFKQLNFQEDTKDIQTTFKLANRIVQNLKEIINDASASPHESALFIHVEDPTNYIADNMTVNGTILRSKENLEAFSLILLSRS